MTTSSPLPHEPPAVDDDRRALVEARLEAIRRLLHLHAAAGVLLTHRREFAWLTVGGLNHVVLAAEVGSAPVLVTAGEAVVLAPVNEAPRIADEELDGLPLVVEETPWWEPDAAAEIARRRVGGGRLLDVAAIDHELRALRQRLAGVEHRRLEWLGRLARVAVDASIAGVAPGTGEHDVAAAALATAARAGARCPVILVAADERIDRYRHPLPTGRAVERRVMLVVVVERWGLHAALTGFRELSPVDEDLARRQAAVSDVLRAMRDASRPGRTLGDVLAVAQGRYGDLGFADEWRRHHQGGTIGYAGRETIATPADGTVIEAGVALAWNPSVRGAKAEETFYLDDAGRPRVVTDPA